jgi:hypothetical protein
LKKRQTTDIIPSPKRLAAVDLPRTKLSEWLEKSLANKIEQRKQKLAQDMAQNEVSALLHWRMSFIPSF